MLQENKNKNKTDIDNSLGHHIDSISSRKIERRVANGNR